MAYQKKGEYDRAIEDFDESIKLNPNYASAISNRAEAYLNKGEYQRAVRDYDEAIRLKPTSEAVWNGRCWTRAIVGELQAALADCNEALRLQPECRRYVRLARVHLPQDGRMGFGHRRL